MEGLTDAQAELGCRLALRAAHPIASMVDWTWCSGFASYAVRYVLPGSNRVYTMDVSDVAVAMRVTLASGSGSFAKKINRGVEAAYRAERDARGLRALGTIGRALALVFEDATVLRGSLMEFS